MGIAAKLGDQHVGFEPLYQGGHDLSEGPEISLVVGIGKEGEVHRVARARTFAYFANPACTGEEVSPPLMKGDSEHPIALVEGVLHPITVMGIDVHIGYSEPLLNQREDGDDCIIENTKAGGAAWGCVVQSPGDIEGYIHLAAGHQRGSK